MIKVYSHGAEASKVKDRSPPFTALDGLAVRTRIRFLFAQLARTSQILNPTVEFVTKLARYNLHVTYCN